MFKSRLCTILLLLSGFAAGAQSIPKLNSISPEWVQRGVTTDIIIMGENLSDTMEFGFADGENFEAVVSSLSKPPVRLESSAANVFSTGVSNDSKRVTAQIKVSSAANLGAQEFRVITPNGVSNPLTINVSDVPEIIEAGNNHSIEEAPKVDLPAGISGKIRIAGQIDYFRFAAKKDQQLVFDVNASRIGSPLDSSLAIFNSKGKELVRSEDVNGLDSIIAFTVPEDGDYILQLRDFQHRGGDNYKYHIIAGEVPYVESIFPFGGQRGKTVELTLRGMNLKGAEKMSVSVDANAPGGPQEVRASTAKGFSNARLFDVSSFPDFFEMEPNESTVKANSISLPGNVNGHIGTEKDEDFFKFKAEKNQRFIFEIYASRFGSKLDPLLTLTDAKGNILQRNDDAMGADARIDQTFAEVGEYFVSIRDLLGRGGENFGYRLSVDPPPPADFSAKLLADTLRINRGGRMIARVEVNRSGFGGPIEISCDNLPEGISCEPIVIPAEFPSGLLLFAANEDAEIASTTLALNASAILNEKKETRVVQPVSGSKPTTRDNRGRERKVLGKDVGTAYLSVLERAPFSVEWVTLSASVEQNQSAKLLTEIKRRGDFNGEVKISVEGFSAGNELITKNFEVAETKVKAKETRAEIAFKAKIDSETGARPIFLRAETTVNGRTMTEFSRPLLLRVEEFPFKLENSLPRLAVTIPARGVTDSAASQAEFSAKTQRRGLFTDNINLSIAGLPNGVSANSTNIVRGSEEAGFKLTAFAEAKPGTNTLNVVGIAEVNGRKFQLRGPDIQFIVNPPAEENQTAAAK